MFKPLSELFSSSQKDGVPQADLKIFIEEWFRQHLKSEKVYCASVSGSRAIVRVGSPTLFQEAYVLRWDLCAELEKVAGYTLKDLSIIPSYY
ncbi:MAG: hypothetical protein HYR90_04935 [Candidatus Andersenbacteria bacterium]|nr:hypothetical protein [Candidatus Andersenbacteria bacterium]MBI3250766.1 hypothetical protein [Candidatus Andersenbacteria bacterium]